MFADGTVPDRPDRWIALDSSLQDNGPLGYSKGMPVPSGSHDEPITPHIDSMSKPLVRPQSLSHSKWDCKYHVVFVPKRRRKAIFGQTRRQLGQIFHGLARQKECQILEGHLMPDHVHMGIASVIGFLKGKSAIAIARLCIKERDFTGEQPLGPPITRYRPSGSELEQVRQYIREQAVLNRAMRRATRDA